MLGIMPLFAFANAGVKVGGDSASALFSPISIGIIAGLMLGKQIGITGFAWLAVKFGLADLPKDVTWPQIYFVSWLGGVGFTMSLFIGGLAFVTPEKLEQAKIAVLCASALSGIGGWVLLRSYSKAPAVTRG
jgi:NhaA family Na+:H+ antiporter